MAPHPRLHMVGLQEGQSPKALKYSLLHREHSSGSDRIAFQLSNGIRSAPLQPLYLHSKHSISACT